MHREEAWKLVVDNVSAPGLRRHMLSVEAAMRGYAERLGEPAETWGLAGLLHDWDWELHPSLEAHPGEGIAELRNRGCDEAILQAILAHNTEGTGVERRTDMDYALLACDEITGLVNAAVLIRPDKDIAQLKLKSVKKRWKSRAFAPGVDRDHVEEATADFSRVCFDGELGLWEHAANVLASMQRIAADLELDGRLGG